ncbi:MAG: class IV adenylate cyclase [Acidobacteria bacterium]|nr:class IV adenylate cyclase [Acidobacteriota bacterium]
MAIEIEKKYKIDADIAARLAEKLVSIGAEFAYERSEENYLHRGGTVDARSIVLRVRKTDDTATLTYKERIDPSSEFKKQIEFETEIGDAAAMEAIIERLGYSLEAVYEKHRKAWNWGGVEIVLDELPFGRYMEIEGPPDGIRDAEKTLGVEHLEVELRSYPSLTLKFGILRDGVVEARFDRKK